MKTKFSKQPIKLLFQPHRHCLTEYLHSKYLYEAEWKKQLSAGIRANIPLLSPVSYHGRKRALVQISVVCRVGFPCTLHNQSQCHSVTNAIILII